MGRRSPEGILGIDVNEKSIDLAIVKPENVRFIEIDVSEAKYIRDRYFRKRGKSKVKLQERRKLSYRRNTLKEKRSE